MNDETLITGLSPSQPSPSTALSPIAALANIPEEEIWLAKQKSPRTRRAYKLDVRHFMRTLSIRSYEELPEIRKIGEMLRTGEEPPLHVLLLQSARASLNRGQLVLAVVVAFQALDYRSAEDSLSRSDR